MKTKPVIWGLLVLFMLSCESHDITTTISNIKVCRKIDSECAENKASFNNSVLQIFSTAQLHNAPEGTKISIKWFYNNEGNWYEIDRNEYTYKNHKDLIISSLKAPINGWPKGNYKVVYSLKTDDSNAVTSEFKIE